MSTGVMGDLITALGLTKPETLSNMSESVTSPPYVFATDWEVSSVDDLVQNTSGPYCEDETIEVEITFSGEGGEFGRVKSREPSYTINTSQNCTLQGKTPPTLTFAIDSNSAGTTGNTIGVTFDNAFSSGTGVGTEQQTSFDVAQFDVTCDNITYDDTNDEVTVDYTIEECGTADYDVEMYRDNDGSPTLANSETQNSTGSYSITDTNPNSGDLDDEYRIDVIDESGSGTTVSCTILTGFPQ